MVPLTFLAFLAAISTLDSKFVKYDYTSFDVAGLIIVAIGVFFHNMFSEKPQESCILENEFNTNINKDNNNSESD